jgi:hypothetical protein
LKRLEPGSGYYVDMKVDDSLNFLSSNYTDLSVDFQTGWNMFSPPSGLNDYSLPTVLSSISGNYSTVYYYNATKALNGAPDPWDWFHPLLPDSSALKRLEPGSGYYINMNNEDTWTGG